MIPYIRKNTLFVHDSPFILLAGETHNSASTCPYAMKKILAKAKELHLNTLLLSVSWEQIEPEQGEFDFSDVDWLIKEARENDLKLCFLWFGSWKNASCMYAPEWIKTQIHTYKRAEIKKGKQFVIDKRGNPYSTLSAFTKETMEADAHAFSTLMKHIKEIDEKENTVIAIQVENETGFLNTDREYSDVADALFDCPVPERLLRILNENYSCLHPTLLNSFQKNKDGNWKEVFTNMAEEVFTAWYTAKYVEFVAKSGKEVYPLPMLTNCWLDKGQTAGKYPTGGPVAKVMDIWKIAAPSIDSYAPDIYVHDYCKVCDEYNNHNLLSIVECATHSYAASRAIYTIGHYHAMCYSPFGIEDLGKEFNSLQGFLFGMDVDDPNLKTPMDPKEYSDVMFLLNGMIQNLAAAYGTPSLQATCAEQSTDLGYSYLKFNKYTFKTVYHSPFQTRRNGACLILEESDDTFFVLLNGCTISVQGNNREFAEILSLEEGYFENQQWRRLGKLNGDEMQFIMSDAPKLLKIKLHTIKEDVQF